jgi:hypothetical protein
LKRGGESRGEYALKQPLFEKRGEPIERGGEPTKNED